MKMKNRRFTLIELIIVIVVIGILAGMALPKFMGVQRDAKAANLKNDCDVLQTASVLLETTREQGAAAYGSGVEGVVADIVNDKLEAKLVAEGVTKVAPLDEAAYKKHLSKLPKTGALADYKVCLDGDIAGSIVYDTANGVLDGEGNAWFGATDGLSLTKEELATELPPV